MRTLVIMFFAMIMLLVCIDYDTSKQKKQFDHEIEVSNLKCKQE